MDAIDANAAAACDEHFSLRSPTATTAASSFAVILDLILSTQERKLLKSPSIKALRLTCKSVRDVIDFHVKSFSHRSHCYWYNPADAPISDILRWRWPNVIEMEFVHREHHGDEDDDKDYDSIIQGNLEHLVTFPLVKLKSLTLVCRNVLPLTESNWPMLTELQLEIFKDTTKDIDEKFAYPTDLQFPVWPLLKKLNLSANFFRSWHQLLRSDFAFLDSFLKSCPGLTHLQIESSSHCTQKLASMIISAPLTQLEILNLRSVEWGFFPTLFEKNWPALKEIKVSRSPDNILHLLASKSWVTHLESLHIGDNERVTVADLRTFLKAIEKGAMKNLVLTELHHDVILQGFKGSKLGNLEQLHLHRCRTSDTNAVDTSESINVLFESCSLPKLNKFKFSSGSVNIINELGHDTTGTAKWNQPPSASIQRLAASVFPFLKKVILSDLDISQDVAVYLGDFRRETGCQLEVSMYSCKLVTRELSPDRQQLLDKLGVDFKQWAQFCKDYVGMEPYEDCVYWDCMSNLQFKRISYASALHAVKNAMQVGKFVASVCEDEEKDSVMTAEVLQLLKDNLERLRAVDYTRLGLEPHFSWENINSLIDYKMNGSLERNDDF